MNDKVKKKPRSNKANKAPEKLVTHLEGIVPTMPLTLDYKSIIINDFLRNTGVYMLGAFERIGGLLKMLAKDPSLLNQVKNWHENSISIAQDQLTQISVTRESIAAQFEGELVEIQIPASYKKEFVVSHPVAHTMKAMLQMIDEELSLVYQLYMAGAVEESQYQEITDKAVSVIRGVCDRIYKGTSPGKNRDSGNYTHKELVNWLKVGNKLGVVDAPKDVQVMMNDGATQDSDGKNAKQSDGSTQVSENDSPQIDEETVETEAKPDTAQGEEATA